MKDIRGSHDIVTGASRGIGTYIAKTLAAQGVSLTLAARDAAKLEDTRGVCEALGVRAIAVPTDVTSREDLRELVETAGRELGPIDIVVNNAGIEITKSLQDTSLDEIDAVVRTNLSAPVWLIKMVLPQMVERRRGAIVNVSSLAGKSCAPYDAIYAATKAGLIEKNSHRAYLVCIASIAEFLSAAGRVRAAPQAGQSAQPNRLI